MFVWELDQANSIKNFKPPHYLCEEEASTSSGPPSQTAGNAESVSIHDVIMLVVKLYLYICSVPAGNQRRKVTRHHRLHTTSFSNIDDGVWGRASPALRLRDLEARSIQQSYDDLTGNRPKSLGGYGQDRGQMAPDRGYQLQPALPVRRTRARRGRILHILLI